METMSLQVIEMTREHGARTAEIRSEAAMCAAGGAAFPWHTSIDRLFRDAHAGAVMAPTGDEPRDLIGKAVFGMESFR